MRFLFINQFIPPDASPTARLLGELSEHLRQRGHSVCLIASGQDYHHPSRSRFGRYLREIKALCTLLMRGLSAPRPDVVLSLTSPPCLLIPATLIATLRGAKSAHWVMDLYPEIAVALGEISPNILTRILQSLMGFCYRRAALVVGLDEDMAQRLAKHGVQARSIRPWPASFPEMRQPPKTAWKWLYSGNLGRAHEWRALLDAQKMLENRGLAIELIFQGGGSARAEAAAYAETLELKKCHWQEYIAEENLVQSLLDASVLIATQKPEAQGLLWPSKLALLLQLPRPILWVGPTDGKIAKELGRREASGVFAPNEAKAVADWIEQTHHNPPELHCSPSIDEKQRSLEQWSEWLEGLTTKSTKEHKDFL